MALAEAEAADMLARAEARTIAARNLPAVAAAVGQGMGDTKVVSIGSDGLGHVASAVRSVLELACPPT